MLAALFSVEPFALFIVYIIVGNIRNAKKRMSVRMGLYLFCAECVYYEESERWDGEYPYWVERVDFMHAFRVFVYCSCNKYMYNKWKVNWHNYDTDEMRITDPMNSLLKWNACETSTILQWELVQQSLMNNHCHSHAALFCELQSTTLRVFIVKEYFLECETRTLVLLWISLIYSQFLQYTT